MQSIVEIELKNVADRLKGRGLTFDFTPAAKQFLIDQGYDEKFGARPLRRSIERHLEDALAESILAGTIKEDDALFVDVNEEKSALAFKQLEDSTKTSGQ